MKPNTIFYTLFTALLLALAPTVWPLPVRAAGNNYTISSPGSCTAFLAAIGATGQEAGDTCYVFSGTLPAGDTLTVDSDQMLRPQTEAFTNRGTINITASATYYGAGTFNNEGTLNIVSTGSRLGGGQNFNTINNAGTIYIATSSDFFNGGTINNATTGTINNAGELLNSGTINNAGGTANTGVLSHIVNGFTRACGILNNTGTLTGNSPIDKCPPKASPSQSPMANNSGWNNTDVTVTWNWSDNIGGSGLDTALCTTSSVSSGEGQLTLSATCQDHAGNVGTASYIVKVDKTAPTISAVVTTQPNSNGWYNSNVTVRFTCADMLSGVTSCPADQVLSSEGTAVASTAQTVVDQAGNSSVASNVVTVKIDKTAPTISAAATGASNANGWYNSNVTVRFTCVDGLSGVASCPADQVLSSEGAAVASTAQTVVDQAGNSSVASNVVTVKIDKTAPTISAAATGTPNANGWYNSNVTVQFTCADGLSGVASCLTDLVLSSEGAAVASTAQTIIDLAGNSSAASNVVTVKIDKTAPTISAAATTQPNANGWYNSDVTVQFTCADNLSGVTSCPADEILSSEGAAIASTTQTITDLAGNSSAASNVITVQIDKTAPTISAAATTQPNANGWYNSDVTVRFTCADGLSGVASCPADELLSSEGNAVASTAETITDLAGNSSAASNVVTVQIDKTAPVVTVTGVSNNASYPLGSVPAAGCSTTDALSGVATQATFSVTGGNPDGTGSFTVTCSGATDNAGNSGSASGSYSVAYNWTGFFQPVDNLPIVNTVNAGQAIPVKFSLGGNYGLNIFATGYPASQQVSCGGSGGGSTSPIEETVTAGNSSLQYDPGTQRYSYVWKTDKAWAATCRLLIVKLIDGTEHTAFFQFNGNGRSAGESDTENGEAMVQRAFLPLVDR